MKLLKGNIDGNILAMDDDNEFLDRMPKLYQQKQK